MVRWLSLKGEFRQREREGRGGGGLEGIENEGEKIHNCVNNSLFEKCCAVKFDCQIGPFSYAKTKGYSQNNFHVSLFLFLFYVFFFIFTYLHESMHVKNCFILAS